MLFQCESFLYIIYVNHIKNPFLRRKETLSPFAEIKTLPPTYKNENRRRAFFFAPLKAGMTVEASMILPVFVICMAALIYFGTVMGMAARYGNALCETGEKMAVSAYASEYGEKNTILVSGLSAAYAGSSVLGKAGKSEAVKNTNFLLSSFLKENDMIHLVMTYQVKTPMGGIKLPGVFFIQRASVRGWTGRKGSDGASGEEGGDDSAQTVFVTEHGTVYHTDIQCTHIKLSIRQVSRESLTGLRNTSGEIYHSCEKCGSKAGDSVYITEDGNRYHSSLECSGLKRTVNEVSLEEIENLRPCSKCGG